MPIVSIKFVIFIFSVFIIYYVAGKIVPSRQWYVLLAASIIFYACSSLNFLAYLLGLTSVTWVLSLLIEKASNRYRKLFLIISIVSSAGMLCMVKYTNLFMPLGVSFFTFQSLGYTIDVYKNSVQAEKNPLRYLLFVCFFPQICQGPIGRYGELAPQLYSSKQFDYESWRDGLERTLVGFFKKVFIANNISIIVDRVYSEPSKYSGAIFLPIAILYTLQLYADFSGYSDIVIGISKSLGIQLRENFETPFFSRSISEYWRRWHISLSSWLRDYIYIPLGGNRKSKYRKLANLLIVFLVSGIWHGSSVSYVIWGLGHGILIVAENVGIIPVKKLEKNKVGSVLSWLYTFLAVSILYVFFRAASFQEASTIFSKFVSNPFYSGWSGGLFYYTEVSYWKTLIIVLVLLVVIDLLEYKNRLYIWLNNMPIAVKWIVLDIMLFSVLYSTIFSNIPALSTSDFLYFNF